LRHRIRGRHPLQRQPRERQAGDVDLLNRAPGILKAIDRRFGNKLEPRQVNSLVRLASAAETDAQATAAAALMGALSLPNKDLIPLILGEQK